MLRPRTEPKSYAEAPDIVLLPAKVNGRQQNGNIDSDTDEDEKELPPIIAIKVRRIYSTMQFIALNIIYSTMLWISFIYDIKGAICCRNLGTRSWSTENARESKK